MSAVPHSPVLRCVGCRLHPAHCICDVIRAEAGRLRDLVRTRVVIVIHAKEMSRSTNTGFLAAQLLPGSELRVRGAKDRAVELDDLRGPAVRSVLLFPEPDAERLTAAPGAEPPLLVVPDGTWRQANRMVHRDRVLSRLPRVTLAPSQPAGYALRTSPRPGALCTIEAIGRALGLLEGPETGPTVRRALMTVLDAQVRATLRMRGRA